MAESFRFQDLVNKKFWHPDHNEIRVHVPAPVEVVARRYPMREEEVYLNIEAAKIQQINIQFALDRFQINKLKLGHDGRELNHYIVDAFYAIHKKLYAVEKVQHRQIISTFYSKPKTNFDYLRYWLRQRFEGWAKKSNLYWGWIEWLLTPEMEQCEISVPFYYVTEYHFRGIVPVAPAPES